MEGEGRIVVGDLEAGLGTVLRLEPGDADLVLVVANRVAGEDDIALIRSTLGDEHELFEVPEDPGIADADRQGTAPIDAAPDSPGVRALVALAGRVRAAGVS